VKAFELVTPSTLAQAFEALPTRADDSSARVLAGGQDLLGEMKDHLIEPGRLVNLKRIPELGGIVETPGDGLDIGALVTISELAEHPRVRGSYVGLAEAAESIASPQIRNVGTVGGNLCQRPRCWYYRHEGAKCLKKGGEECFSYEGLSKYNAILGGGPSYIVHPSDLAPALVCLGAEVVLQSAKGGQRKLPLEKFYKLPSEGDVTRETVLEPGEIVTRILVQPIGRRWRSTYIKFKERGSFDFALVSVALALELDGGNIRRARLCLGGVAPIPWRSPSAEALLATGSASDPASWKAAAEEALRGAEPLRHNAYKIPLAKGLIQRALQRLLS
jgi:xanthine dehydrogenase YagS FAD-binding subunit